MLVLKVGGKSKIGDHRWPGSEGIRRACSNESVSILGVA